MLDDKMVSQLEASLRRIFAMKITRSTFRELQNVLITVSGGSRDLTNDLFESLYTGQLKDSLKGKSADQLKTLLTEFSIPIRLSKEIFERGEFVNIITSDTITQKDTVAFLNRIRRIDGEEFLFITDPESTVHLLQHFTGRLQELSKMEQGEQLINNFKKDLLILRNKLDELAKGAASVK
jgi:hypothetical protein